MKQRVVFLLQSIILVAAILMSTSANATPYWTPKQIAEQEQNRHLRPVQQEANRVTNLNNTLDDPDYFGDYVQLCDFLTGLQFWDVGHDNHGGMREGESGNDWDIVQTDNTQEAIRAWSLYALWTGDTAAYGDNIRAAWEYCRIHQAWEEEGGNGSYYQIHNCGWGIEATLLYSQAYQDTSWNWYADSCSWQVVNNSLTASQLDRYSLGLGIGGLYQWGEFRGRQDWIDEAIDLGTLLRDWLNSSARIAGDNWALCGGTAVWGVCRSLFAAYPDSGRAWIDEYGLLLPTFDEVEASDWYNSFRTWNSNALFACSEFSSNPEFDRRVRDYAIGLLGLDTDDDGGIPPGTCCDETNDHAWVSAYMGWMAISNVMNGPPVLTAPNASIPHPAGIPLTLAASIRNSHQQQVTASVRMIGYGLDLTETTLIDGFGQTELEFTQTWTLPDDDTLPDQVELMMITTRDYPEGDVVDTLITAFDIRRQIRITGTIRGEFDVTEMPPCRIEFFNTERTDTVYIPFPVQTGTSYSSGDVPVFAGEVHITIVPPARYLILDTIVTVQPETDETFDFNLTSTEILLVDDDGETTAANGNGCETYYTSPLQTLELATRTWSQSSDVLDDIAHISTIIWITGGGADSGPSTTEIDAQEQQLITQFLTDGGKLLLSGQDITENLRGSEFLGNTLHCTALSDTVPVENARITGDGVHPLFGTLMFRINEGTGALNQYSPSSMIPAEGAETILYYPSQAPNPPETAAIAGTYEQGRFIFAGFGIEALATSSGAFTERAELIALCLDWLNETESVKTTPALLPETFALYQNYPNPFNPSTTIRFEAPEGANFVSLTVYDLLGREVANLFSGQSELGIISIEWDGRTNTGQTVSSGTYIYTLSSDKANVSRVMKLVR